MKLPTTYISNFEFFHISLSTDIGIQIRVCDEDWKGDRNILIRDAQPMMTLEFWQGIGGGKANNGHFNAIRHSPEKTNESKSKIEKFLGIDIFIIQLTPPFIY
jgi:hypothetical protein